MTRGYWQDAGNVEAELRHFMEAQGMRGRMPKQAEVQGAREFALDRAIAMAGGYRALAARLGCALETRRFFCLASGLLA